MRFCVSPDPEETEKGTLASIGEVFPGGLETPMQPAYPATGKELRLCPGCPGGLRIGLGGSTCGFGGYPMGETVPTPAVSSGRTGRTRSHLP